MSLLETVKENFSAGDECFENVCTKGHKSITTAIV